MVFQLIKVQVYLLSNDKSSFWFSYFLPFYRSYQKKTPFKKRGHIIRTWEKVVIGVEISRNILTSVSSRPPEEAGNKGKKKNTPRSVLYGTHPAYSPVPL